VKQFWHIYVTIATVTPSIIQVNEVSMVTIKTTITLVKKLIVNVHGSSCKACLIFVLFEPKMDTF
jgi:hypothetical protein